MRFYLSVGPCSGFIAQLSHGWEEKTPENRRARNSALLLPLILTTYAQFIRGADRQAACYEEQ
jgi:hypothetical protein